MHIPFNAHLALKCYYGTKIIIVYCVKKEYKILTQGHKARHVIIASVFKRCRLPLNMESFCCSENII